MDQLTSSTVGGSHYSDGPVPLMDISISLEGHIPPSEGSSPHTMADATPTPDDVPLIPDRAPDECAPWELHANPVSLLLVSWIWPVLKRGASGVLEVSDLPGLLPSDTAEQCHRTFEKYYARYSATVDPGMNDGGARRRHRYPVVYVLHRISWPLLLSSGLLKLLNDLLKLAVPFVLRELLETLSAEPFPVVAASLYAAAIPILLLVTSLLQAHIYLLLYRLGLRVQTSLTSVLYAKALRLNLFRTSHTSGELSNVVTSDVSQLSTTITFAHAWWSGIVQVVLVLLQLGALVGSSTWAGVGVLVLSIPVSSAILRIVARTRKHLLTLTDTRLKLISDSLNAIRTIKCFGYEALFEQAVDEERARELKLLRRYVGYQSLLLSLFFAVPTLASVVVLSLYAGLGNELTPATSFSVIVLFNLLVGPFGVIPFAFSSYVESWVSAKRLQAFLDLPEVTPRPVEASVCDERRPVATSTAEPSTANRPLFSTIAIHIEAGTFRWSLPEDYAMSSTSAPPPRASSETRDENSVGSTGAREVSSGTPFPPNPSGGPERPNMPQDDSGTTPDTFMGPPVLSPEFVTSSMGVPTVSSNTPTGPPPPPPSAKPTARGGSTTPLPSTPSSTSTMSDSERDSFIRIEAPQPVWKPALHHISVQLPRGQLVAIVGPVGSGKTSLLLAILGELVRTSGQTHVEGSVAYAPQQPWVENGTLRENVLFGESWDPRRYREAIYVSGLSDDLKQLPLGELTELGESGYTLSGGQQTRVSVARCTYSERSIYLLDDPLSALDAYTGSHVFFKCFSNAGGYLCGHTRVLVLNYLHYLDYVDYVVYIQRGEVCQAGPVTDLLGVSQPETIELGVSKRRVPSLREFVTTGLGSVGSTSVPSLSMALLYHLHYVYRPVPVCSLKAPFFGRPAA